MNVAIFVEHDDLLCFRLTLFIIGLNQLWLKAKKKGGGC